MVDLPSELAEILKEARRLTDPGLPYRLQQEPDDLLLVLEIVADDTLGARRLTNALNDFCDARHFRRRFLVVRSTPRDGGGALRMPKGWPPEGPEDE